MKQTEKNIYVIKPTLPNYFKYIKKIKKIWNTNILTNQGPLHEEFKEKIKQKLEIKNATLFCNGHLALESAIKVLNMKEKGEIITTPFTFVSTTNAIINCGFKPVFCDIKMDDYTIDEKEIEKLINKNTVAILPVHVYGYPCNIKKIADIAKKYNLKVIYDAAHAFGVKVNNKSILTYGDISMVSFHATKLFNTIEGGILSYENKDLIEKLDALKNFGLYQNEYIIDNATNAKMNEFSAAMGILNLENVEKNILKRKSITNLYKKYINVNGISFIKEKTGIKYNYSYLPVLIDEKRYGLNRDELFKILESHNIYCRKYFYPLTSEMIDKYSAKSNTLKNAKYVSERIMTLPLYPTLSKKDILRICEIINSKGDKNE